MTNLTTTVYLNQSPQHYCGFDTDATLQAVATFTLTMDRSPSTEHLTAALEHVFEQLNIDDPDQSWAQGYRRTGLRSLSVGDVVVIGETAWACAASGWTHLTADQLHAATPDH
ncbi:conserved hypothetical protein [uncultured Mycobacterium sp.]|uniref:Uncharacterized protein n=1 Tax=uncultured Mycobacterium sp. TaxID=171292 RepID=A0A1Y5PJJ0_9MYCO|nr:conserved hypothetical protein [uncultured Mycobacterium sp.]